MGLYARWILPRLLEKSMSNPAFQNIRKTLLARANGKILEIGIGSGLNLPLYPPHVRELTAIDTNEGFSHLLKKRIAASKMDVHHVTGSVESLPFADKSFDTIVSTWTLCSIENIDRALKELHRVLAPNGVLLFVEHGIGVDVKTKLLQHAVTPFWKLYKGGCRLNRDMKAAIEGGGFTFETYREYDLPGIKRLTRRTYEGVAYKAK